MWLSFVHLNSVDSASQVRGGSVDALIVLATQTIKNDFLYQVRVLMRTT